MVESLPSKQVVAGSSPVSRSTNIPLGKLLPILTVASRLSLIGVIIPLFSE